jgi:16S rRNA (cytosine1402-N4)-methyltransferase
MAHTPVMLAEVLAALSPRDGATYVDATFGAGGYARGILAAANCRVIGIDRDPGAAAFAADLAPRCALIHGNFKDIQTLVPGPVDGLVADLGVSSMQIDQPARGFAFQADGPLDMRMDTSAGGPTAADIVNESREEDLADLIYRYGGERHARRVARALVAGRPFARTGALADAIRAVVPRSRGHAIDPATRTFQALRIAVNDEIGALEAFLAAAPRVLAPGGRLVVVSFHSLEDGAVKRCFRALPAASRHEPEGPAPAPALFRQEVRRAITPSAQEVAANPRARSARLRWATRTEAPA